MDFLTSIAHEIRTPLTLVQVPLEALMRKFSSSHDASVQENLDIIRRNSLKLTILINELLDFRKLSDSTFQIRPEFIDVRGVVKDAHRRFHPMFLQEGKSLSISIPDNPVYCETDVRSFGRILDNLLSNALKYSQHHTSIILSADGKDAVLHLENDGKIIPEDFRKKVFKPFYRYEGHDSAGIEGTGLGLSTSLQFAQMLGGSLMMDDDMSVNRFIFTVPLAASQVNNAPLADVRTKEKVVMIVEDDKDMIKVVKNILQESYDIVTASNGKEALAHMEGGVTPALIVSDVIMPEMDGITLLRKLKMNVDTSHIPVIVLSGKNKLQDRMLGIETGADAYIPKPFYMNELKSTAANLISNRLIMKGKFSGNQEQKTIVESVHIESTDEQFMKQVVDLINKNLSNSEFNVEQMMRDLRVSKSKLNRKIKDITGFSPARFIQNIRMQQAKVLLNKTLSANISEIAYEVGFSSQTHFSTTFKSFFGITPSEYLRQKGIKNEEQPETTAE